MNYKYGAFDGKNISWHDNGQKECEGYFKDDYQDGK